MLTFWYTIVITFLILFMFLETVRVINIRYNKILSIINIILLISATIILLSTLEYIWTMLALTFTIIYVLDFFVTKKVISRRVKVAWTSILICYTIFLFTILYFAIR